jgi:hypothetical protein
MARARVLVPARKLRKGEELGLLGLIHSGGTPFIDDRGRRPSSRASERRRRIGRSPVLHRAACRPEEEDDSKRYLGWAAELGCWAGLMGYGQVSPSSLFFSSSIPFLFVLFPGFNSSI